MINVAMNTVTVIERYRGIINMRQVKTLLQSDYFILFLIAAVYVIIVSVLALSRHYAFDTNTWDLGIYSQSLYSTLNHGKPLYYTAELAGNPSGSLFGIHFSPFLFLLVPIYGIFQNPATLLVLRPIAISIGLIPLYWIIREHKINNRAVTFFLAAIYVVYPPITTPLSNFDVEVFLPALFLFAIYYMRKEKLVHSFVFVVLALMVNEFVPLIVISMALYVFILHRTEIINGIKTKKLTKHTIFALTLLLSAVIVFNVASAVITSFNPNALNTKWEWGEFGSSPGEIVTNVITDPLKTINTLLNDGQAKFLYLTALFAPLAFLSFLDPLTLIMTTPWLTASLLSVNPLYYAIGTQYPAFVSPFLFVAAVAGIKKLINFSSKDILRPIVFLMFVGLILSTLLLPNDEYFSVTKSDETTKTALNLIPPKASVSAMPEVFPHLCNRLEGYPYFKDDVEYLLVDIYSWWYTVTLPQPAHTAPKWRDAKIGADYGIIVNANGVLLYKKGYNRPPEYFEGITFTYTASSVQTATGTFVQDTIPIENSTTTADVLLHTGDDPTPLFFKTPENVLPPGNYKIAVMLKTSFTTPNQIITLAALNKPEDSEIITKTIKGNDFTTANNWQEFTFNFTLKQPTFIDFTASVTKSTNVSFYSITISQESGGI